MAEEFVVVQSKSVPDVIAKRSARESFAVDRRLLSVASVIVVLAVWQWGSGHVSGFLLPAPAEVLGRFLDPKWLTRLIAAFGQSLIQLGLGFGLTLLVAIPLGVVIGRSRVLTRMFEPVINAIYAIPGRLRADRFCPRRDIEELGRVGSAPTRSNKPFSATTAARSPRGNLTQQPGTTQ